MNDMTLPPIARDPLTEDAQDIERLIVEVDQNEAAVLGAAKDMADLDGRGTLLMLAAASLFAICKTQHKPDGVEVMGLRFTFGDWKLMALVVAAFVLYLLVLFLFANWAELRRWRLTRSHTVRASLARIEELRMHAHNALALHLGRSTAMAGGAPEMQMRQFDFPMEGRDAAPPVEEVMAWFENQALSEKDRFRSLGWLDQYTERRWERSIRIEREFMRKKAELARLNLKPAEYGAALDPVFAARRAMYKKLGWDHGHQSHTVEQGLFDDLKDHSHAALRRIRTLVWVLRLRFVFVAALPLAVAFYSLMVYFKLAFHA
jgi:uncharacterized membrane protein